MTIIDYFFSRQPTRIPERDDAPDTSLVAVRPHAAGSSIAPRYFCDVCLEVGATVISHVSRFSFEVYQYDAAGVDDLDSICRVRKTVLSRAHEVKLETAVCCAAVSALVLRGAFLLNVVLFLFRVILFSFVSRRPVGECDDMILSDERISIRYEDAKKMLVYCCGVKKTQQHRVYHGTKLGKASVVFCCCSVVTLSDCSWKAAEGGRT